MRAPTVAWTNVGYREFAPPATLRDLVECAWVVDGPPAPVRVLPDGCMDLIRMDGRVVVAGPGHRRLGHAPRRRPVRGPTISARRRSPDCWACPRRELRNDRVPLADLRSVPPQPRSLTELATELAADRPRAETAPWSLPLLSHVTASLAAGSAVVRRGPGVGWSTAPCSVTARPSTAMARRRCGGSCVSGARALLGDGLPYSEVAARAGYADQPHLHREVRDLAGVPLASLRQDSSGAKRSTQLPSGSATVA